MQLPLRLAGFDLAATVDASAEAALLDRAWRFCRESPNASAVARLVHRTGPCIPTCGQACAPLCMHRANPWHLDHV